MQPALWAKGVVGGGLLSLASEFLESVISDLKSVAGVGKGWGSSRLGVRRETGRPQSGK